MNTLKVWWRIHRSKAFLHKIFIDYKKTENNFTVGILADTISIGCSKWAWSVMEQIKPICHLTGCNEKNIDSLLRDSSQEIKHNLYLIMKNQWTNPNWRAFYERAGSIHHKCQSHESQGKSEELSQTAGSEETRQLNVTAILDEVFFAIKHLIGPTSEPRMGSEY